MDLSFLSRNCTVRKPPLTTVPWPLLTILELILTFFFIVFALIKNENGQKMVKKRSVTVNNDGIGTVTKDSLYSAVNDITEIVALI